MPDAGHLFVVQSDLTTLACDDILIPTDARAHVTAPWRHLGAPTLPVDWGDDRIRVTPPNGNKPHVRWVNTGSHESRADLNWLLAGVQQALIAIGGEQHPNNLHGRARRLVAIPIFGTGTGGFNSIRGKVLNGLLDVCENAVGEHSFDLAIVCWHRSDYAAIQSQRALRRDSHPSLRTELTDKADALGGLAARGELALFLGAGVSAAAGLPTWSQLIEDLASKSPLYADRAAELGRIAPPDAAYLLSREAPSEFRLRLKDALERPSFALGHALLASLRAPEAITTNFDGLYEKAWV